MNQEDLLQFLHLVHNKIRNANGLKLTGLAALNEINNFFALYFIKDIVVKKGLPKECSFDEIYTKYATDDIIKGDRYITCNQSDKRMAYKMWKNVYDSSNDDCLMRQIVCNDYFSSYFANDITKASAYSNNSRTCETIQEIINMIYKKFKDIDFKDYKMYDALGSAYERFKTDEISNSGKNTGQHFTPVSIKKIIIDELKPSYEDSFYEPCSGSGGFIHTACHYVYEHDKDNLEKFKKKIYANEINPEIQKPLMINMLLHDIPVKHINWENEADSLSQENCKRYMNKMTKCGTNVPFGVKTTLTNFSGYWDPVANGKTIMKESTAQFIVHIYNCLKDNGVAGIVVDRGILNNGTEGNSWQKKFRQWLLENNDLYKIIYMPTGIFDYTNFATAIIFFKKGRKTKKVDFYEANFVDPKKKGDVKIGEKVFKSMTLKEIENNNWSLKVETEPKKELKAGWVKLGDVIKYVKHVSKDASVVDNNGKHIYYSSSIINYQYTNEYTNDDECLIINKTNGSGKSKIFYNNKTKFCASSATIVFNFNSTYNIKFGYYYLQIMINEVQKLYTGSDKKSLNNSSFEELHIPSLSLPHQTEIVEFLDEQFEKYNVNLLTDKIKNIKLFDLLIAKQYDMCADALHLIYRKIETDVLIKSMERDKKAVFNMLLNGCDYEIVKLEDVIKYYTGKRLPDKEKYSENNTKYKYLRVEDVGKQDINNCASITKLHYEVLKSHEVFEGDLIFTKDGSIGKTMVIPKTEFKIIMSEQVIKLELINKKCSLKYFNYLLISLENELVNHKTGGGIPHLKLSVFINYDIKLPSLEDQTNLIKEIEKIEKEQSTYKQYGDMFQGLLNNMQNIIKKTTDGIVLEEKQNENLDKYDNNCGNESEDEKPKKKLKAVKQKKKIVSNTDNSSNSSNSSDNDSDNSFNKLNISKADLKFVDLGSKDMDTHYYHKKHNCIYSESHDHKWCKFEGSRQKRLMEIFEKITKKKQKVSNNNSEDESETDEKPKKNT